MEIQEVQYKTVTSETVFPADGSPSYRLYHVEGMGDYRWPEFLDLLDRQREDAREAEYERNHRPGETY